MCLKWPKKLSNFGQNVWKYRLTNTVTSNLDTTLRQMTEMSQWPKGLSKNMTEMSQRKKQVTSGLWRLSSLACARGHATIFHSECWWWINDNSMLEPFSHPLMPTWRLDKLQVPFIESLLWPTGNQTQPVSFGSVWSTDCAT